MGTFAKSESLAFGAFVSWPESVSISPWVPDKASG